MKYYESPRTKKFAGTFGFYAVIACCLLAIGGASWFALSRFRSSTEQPDTSSPSETESADHSYGTSSGAYSSTATPAADSVAKSVSDIPDDRAASDTESTESAAPAPEPEQALIAPVEGEITKDYSEKALQYSATYDDMRLHSGTDFACAAGTAVKACGKGSVTAVDESATLGKTVTVDHGSGIIIKYCGLDTVLVTAGSSVKMGDSLGASGTVPSECAEESHIHLEATKDGKPVSPASLLGLQ